MYSFSSTIESLQGQLIVSCQASSDEPFYETDAMKAMVLSVIRGGAKGLRLAGYSHILAIKPLTNLPIIGLTKPKIIPKNYKDMIYITPTKSDAELITDAGADIIAIDATLRERPAGESLENLVQFIHDECCKPIMADISTYEEGVNASRLGCDIISTTLSGYTNYSLSMEGPDFNLLEKLVNNTNTPIILEGRITTPEEVKHAFELGAYAVVIGSIITRPHYITKLFATSVPNKV